MFEGGRKGVGGVLLCFGAPRRGRPVPVFRSSGHRAAAAVMYSLIGNELMFFCGVSPPGMGGVLCQGWPGEAKREHRRPTGATARRRPWTAAAPR